MRNRIKELLRGVFHPELEQDIVTAGIFEGAEIEGEKVVVSLIFRKARDPFATKIKSRVEQTIASAYPDYKVVVVVKEGEKSAERAAKNAAIEEMHNLSTTANIKHIVAVASGKRGVGKSTVTANLAVALSNEGYRVGVLDADITGPSAPTAFGVTECQGANEDGLYPALTRGGIQVMSINLLLDDPNSPVVWRGPVIAGAVKQFWTDVIWEDVDYLFVDMPPGTGDVPITVFQCLPVDGIVVVTSPQDLVGMIVRKAVNMAGMMNIPALGLVENMSYALCPDCGKKIEVFGKSHLDEVAAQFNLPILARLPIDPKVAESYDSGKMEDVDTSKMEKVLEAVLKA